MLENCLAKRVQRHAGPLMLFVTLGVGVGVGFRFGGGVVEALAAVGLVAVFALHPSSLPAQRRHSELRSLDAIHLATAVSIGADLGALFSYDHRLTAAATAAGVHVLAPD